MIDELTKFKSLNQQELTELNRLTYHKLNCDSGLFFFFERTKKDLGSNPNLSEFESSKNNKIRIS